MSLQDSVNLSKARPGVKEHICIGCAKRMTTHPSMICRKCAGNTKHENHDQVTQFEIEGMSFQIKNFPKGKEGAA